VKGKLWVVEVEGVACRLWGWVGGLRSEVSKVMRDGCIPPAHELYYYKKKVSRERVRRREGEGGNL
jgi:hypothetical protein